MKRSLFPILFLVSVFAIILMADDSLFEGISMTERLLMTNTVNKSYAILQTGTALDPSCASLILGGTNGVGKLELEACSILGVDRTLLRAGATDSIILDYQTGQLNLGNSGAENVAVGNISKTLTLPSLTTIIGAGASWGGGDLVWSGTGGTLTNLGNFTSIKTITASNFVQSAGSAGGFVGNGSGLTNLTIPAGSLPASVLTNLTTTVPWLTWSGQGTRVMNLATNSTAIGVANGGTGTGTTFTQGSVVFAGASGIYSQNNGNFFWDDTNRRLGLGVNSSLLAKLHTVSTNGTDSGIFVDSYSSTATQGSSIVQRRAEGTAGSPTAVLSGDLLGSLGARGYGATGFTASSRAKIHAMASENWSDTAQGTRYEFYTTAVGTTNTTEGMRLTDADLLGVGTTTPLARIHSVATNGVVFTYMGDSYSSTSTDDSAGFIGRRARGTVASPSAVNSGDILSIFTGRGYGTTGFSTVGRGRMQFEASETWTDTAQGARTVFYNTLSTTTNTTESMRIHNDGSVGIGTNAIISTIKLAVTGTTEIFGGAAAIAPSDGQNNFVINGSTNGGLGYIQMLGGRANTRTVTATNYVLGIGDYYLFVTNNNATTSVTLPAATALPSGGTFLIANDGTNATVNIIRAGSDTLFPSGVTNQIVTTTAPAITAGGVMRTVVGDGVSAWRAYGN